MSEGKWWKKAAWILVVCAATCVTAGAQSFTLLDSFDGTDGGLPRTVLVQGLDGEMYGTTESGGLYGSGTVFKLSPNGALTSVFSFNQYDGGFPIGSLALGTDGASMGSRLLASPAPVLGQYSRFRPVARWAGPICSTD